MQRILSTTGGLDHYVPILNTVLLTSIGLNEWGSIFQELIVSLRDHDESYTREDSKADLERNQQDAEDRQKKEGDEVVEKLKKDQEERAKENKKKFRGSSILTRIGQLAVAATATYFLGPYIRPFLSAIGQAAGNNWRPQLPAQIPTDIIPVERDGPRGEISWRDVKNSIKHTCMLFFKYLVE